MVGMTKAKIKARAAIESLYTGTCSIYQYQDVTDETTKLTRKSEVLVAESLPCRLSFESLSKAQQSDTAAGVNQVVKLILAPETDVMSGSKIVIEQNGKVFTYQVSGVPAVYYSHQEILLDIFRGWA